MSTEVSVAIALPTTLARQLPADNAVIQQVIELGLSTPMRKFTPT
jgi:hypothetical protein